MIHCRNLQQCLDLGVKLKKDTHWMKPYIDFNVVYGKTMENTRKRIKIRVVKNSKNFIKYTSRPLHALIGKYFKTI